MAIAAKEFGQRPSDLLAIEDPLLALAFDLAALERLVEMRQEALEGPVKREEW